MAIMSVHLKIILTKRNHSYYSTGETIFGAVHIVNESGVELKLLHGLYVVFFGGAATDLKGARVRNGVRVVSTPDLLHQGRNKFADHQMRGKEFYLNKKVPLTSSSTTASSSGSRTIRPGDNVFPFQLQLPLNLISSFRGAHGLISYDISTSIRLLTGSLAKTYSAKREFQVIATTVIYPPMRPVWEAEVVEFHKQLSQWRCINASVICPVRECLPGECLHTNVSVNSTIGQAIRKIWLELVQEITYKCPVGSFTDCHMLTSTGSNDWGESISVPLSVRVPNHLPPSTMSNDGVEALISIKYFLSIKLKLDSQLELVKVGKILIEVGTVRSRGLKRQPLTPLNQPGANASGQNQSQNYEPTPEDLPEGQSQSTSAPPYALLYGNDSVQGYRYHQNSVESVEEEEQDEDEDEFVDVSDESPPPTYAEAMEMWKMS